MFKKPEKKKPTLDARTLKQLREYNLWIEYVERHSEDLLKLLIRRNVFTVLKMEKDFATARKKTLFYLAKEAHEDSWLISEKMFFYLKMFCYSPMMRHARVYFWK